MEKRVVEVQVVDVSVARSGSGGYTMLLGEVSGRRCFPVIIGASEAQALLIQLRKLTTARPLTHHLFATVLEVLGVKLQRVLIYQVYKGVFYSYLYMQQGKMMLRIDARISDAVVMALTMEAPIQIYEELLEIESFRAGLHGEGTEEGASEDSHDENVEVLKMALRQAVEEEDFELAARLRDRIKAQEENSREPFT